MQLINHGVQVFWHVYKHNRACLCVGGVDCEPGESHEHDVILFGRSEGRRERVVLDTLPYSSYRVRYTKNGACINFVSLKRSVRLNSIRLTAVRHFDKRLSFLK